MPYLMLNNAAGFISFTRAVFNAGLSTQKNRDSGDLIMHAEIMIGGSTIMFCDATSDWPAVTANLFVYVHNADSTYKLALENGGSSVMELSDQSYGRTCGVADPFGNTWWITSVAGH